MLTDLDLLLRKSFSDTYGIKLLYFQANCFNSIAMISWFLVIWRGELF